MLKIPRVREMKASGEWQSRYISAPGLVPVLQTLGDSIDGIEIGVAAGENVCYLLDACPNIRTIFAIDPWLPYTDCNGTGTKEIVDESFLTTLDNFEEYANRVFVIRETSDAVHKRFADNTFDYVFVDGNHDYEFVKRDIMNYYPKVRVGGAMCGHDFGLAGVQRALQEFLSTLPYKANLQVVPNSAWYWIKE